MDNKKPKKIKVKKSKKEKFGIFSTEWWSGKLRWTVSQPFKWLWSYLIIMFSVAVVILAGFFIPATHRRYSTNDYQNITTIVIRYNADNGKYSGSTDNTPDGQAVVTEVRAEISYLLNYGQNKGLFGPQDYSVTSNALQQEVIVSGPSKILQLYSSFNQLLSNNNKITITSDSGGAVYCGANDPNNSKWKDPDPTLSGGDFPNGNDKFGNNWKNACGKFYKKPFEGNVFKSSSSTANTSGDGYVMNFTISNTSMFKSFTQYLYYYLLLKADNKNPYDPSKGTSKPEDFRLYIWLNYKQFLSSRNLQLSTFNAFDYCFQGAGNWDEQNPANTHVNPAAIPTVWDGFQTNYRPSGLIGVYTVSNTSDFANGISSGSINLTNKSGGKGSGTTHHFAATFNQQTGQYVEMYLNNAASNYVYSIVSAGNFKPRLGIDNFVFWMYALSFLILSVLFAIYLILRMRLWGLFASAILSAFTAIFISALIFTATPWAALIFLGFLGSLAIFFHLTLYYFQRIKRAYNVNNKDVKSAWHESRSRQTWLRLGDFLVTGLILLDVFYVVSAGPLRGIAFLLTIGLALTYVLLFLGLQVFTSAVLTSPYFSKRLHLIGLEPWLKSKSLSQKNKVSVETLLDNNELKSEKEYDPFLHHKSRLFKFSNFWKWRSSKFFNKYAVKNHTKNIDISSEVKVLKRPGIFSKWMPMVGSFFFIVAITLGALFATILGPVNGNADIFGKTEFYFTNVSLSELDANSKSVIILENDINKRLSETDSQYYVDLGHYGSTYAPPGSKVIENAVILTVEANNNEIVVLTSYFNHLNDLKNNNLVFQETRTIPPNNNVSYNVKAVILGITFAVLALTAYMIIRFSVGGALAFLFSGSFSVLGVIFAAITFHFVFSYAVFAAIFLALFFGFFFLAHILGRTKSYLNAWQRKHKIEVISVKDVLSIVWSVIRNDLFLIGFTTGVLVLGMILFMILVPYTIWFSAAFIISLLVFAFFIISFLPIMLAISVNLQMKFTRWYKAKAKKNVVDPEEEVLQKMNEMHDF